MYLPSGYSVVKIFTFYSRLFWYSLNNCHFAYSVNLIESEIERERNNFFYRITFFLIFSFLFHFFSSEILVLKILPAFTASCNWKIYANAIIICYLVFPCTHSIPSIHKRMEEIHILYHMQCMNDGVEYTEYEFDARSP